MWTRIRTSTNSKADNAGGAIYQYGWELLTSFLVTVGGRPLELSSLIEASGLVWMTSSSNHATNRCFVFCEGHPQAQRSQVNPKEVQIGTPNIGQFAAPAGIVNM